MRALETRGHAAGQGEARAYKTITILSALSPRVIAKRWKPDGSIAGYDLAKNFTHRVETVGDIRELSLLLLKLERDPQSCVVRGGYIGDELAIPKMRGDERWRPGCVLRSKEVFHDRAMHALMLDIDNYRPRVDPVADPVSAIREFIAKKLPKCFADISFHWQLSSSAGHPSNAGVLKAHLWFWLATPYTSAQLRTWATATGLTVDCALFDPIQAHYTASPLFETGVTDPVRVRSGFSEGLMGDHVPLEIVTTDISALHSVSDGHALDPVAALLYQRGLVRGEIKSGKAKGALNIVCPRQDHHSGGKTGDSATVYYLPHTGGFDRAIFHCLHEHCRGVAQREFLQALGVDQSPDAEGFGGSFEETEIFQGQIEAAQDVRSLVETVCHRIAESAALDKPSRGMLARAVRDRAKRLGREYTMPDCHALIAKRKQSSGVEPDTHHGFAKGLLAHLREKAVGRDSVGSDGVLYVPAKSGIYEQMSLEALSTKVAELYDGRDLCKRASDYSAIARCAYSMVEAPAFFAGAPVGLATPSGFYRVDARDGLTREPLHHDHRQRFVHAMSPEAGEMPEFGRLLSDCFRCATKEEERAQIDFMQEIAGAIAVGLMARHQKAVQLYGPGRSGKGTMTTIMEALVPRDSRCSVSPFRWDSEYYLANMAGKRLNIVGELPEHKPMPASELKTVTGLDLLSGRQPSGRVFQFRNEAAHLFSSNHYISVSDRSDAFFARWLIVGFPNSRIGVGGLDTRLAERIVSNELPAILAWALEGARRLLQRGEFRPTATHHAHMAAWRRRADSVLEFLHDDEVCELDVFEFGCFVSQRGELFEAYRTWCARSGRQPVQVSKFNDALGSPAVAALGVSVQRTSTRRGVVTGVRLVSFFG